VSVMKRTLLMIEDATATGGLASHPSCVSDNHIGKELQFQTFGQ